MSEPLNSFVIRLWAEPAYGGAAPEWRWTAVHIQSRADRSGSKWQDLLAFIAERAKMEPPGAVAAPSPASRP